MSWQDGNRYLLYLTFALSLDARRQSCALQLNAQPNNSMDVRAKQRLCYQRVFLP
jgi:hypothetical protein